MQARTFRNYAMMEFFDITVIASSDFAVTLTKHTHERPASAVQRLCENYAMRRSMRLLKTTCVVVVAR